jgi:hypothetical protein
MSARVKIRKDSRLLNWAPVLWHWRCTECPWGGIGSQWQGQLDYALMHLHDCHGVGAKP